jgi:hypothetical protein
MLWRKVCYVILMFCRICRGEGESNRKGWVCVGEECFWLEMCVSLVSGSMRKG